ncbi:hypothetical protein ABK040_016353 [Willaertia magna]
MQSIQDFEDDNYKGNYHSLNEKDNQQQQQYNEGMKNPNEIKLVNSSASSSSNDSSPNLQNNNNCNNNNYNNSDSVTKTEILLQNDNVVIIAPKKEENSHDNSYNNNYNNNNNCNDNQSKNRNDNNEKIKYFTFWMIAISVHLIMSMNQVFSRFLQHEGSLNQQTPILSLIIISNLIAFILYIPKILFNFIKFYFKNYKNVKNLKNTNSLKNTTTNNFTNLKNNFKNLILSKNIKFYTFICIYLFTTVIGSSLLEFSVKYTQAIYVQLIMLSIPFLVYFTNICFLKTEKFSFIDFIIGFFIIIGTALVIISSSTANDTANNGNGGTGNEYHWKWIPDFTKIGYSFNIPNDPIGITLACIACLFFSMMGCVNIISPKLTKNYTTTAQTTTTVNNNNNNNDTVNKNDNVILVDKQNEKEEEELMFEREFNENNNCHEELFELKQQQLKEQQKLEKEEEKEENVVHYSTLNNDLNQPLLSDYNNNEEDHLVNCHNNSEEEPLIKLTEDYEEEEEEKYNNMESLQLQEEEQKSISPENLFILQKILLFTWPIIPSIILKEDWSIYLNLSLEKWLILISFSILSKGYASLFEVWSSKEIGSGNYTMMLPLRIVLGFILAGVMLREWIDNLFAVLGCVIVVVSIIIFTVRKQHVQNEASGIKNK